MDEELAERVALACGSRPVTWESRRERGYTHNERWVVELEDGRRVFVKGAVDELSAGWLRAEHRVYAGAEAPFLPLLLGWHDGELPVLVLEDLSDAEHAPPWDEVRVSAVLSALAEVAATEPPPGVPAVSAFAEGWRDRWGIVRNDPEPFLALGLCSRRWLDDALPALNESARTAPLAGDGLLHTDVRSDNLCFVGGRAVLYDWNWACVGDPSFDIACWLPSLRVEGGPEPEEILPDVPAGFTALLAGVWAAVAGLPPPPTAPRVRPLQVAQLRVALPWAARALRLPEPVG